VRGFLTSINHALRSALVETSAGRQPARRGRPASGAPSRGAVEHDLIREDEVHLLQLGPSDPPGVRVVPYRPDDRWPTRRRVQSRLVDPFRAFPQRVPALLDLLHPRDPRD
jgi:hypothetical protein